MDATRDEQVVDVTRRWIDAAVIGLNLCPFAPPVVAAHRVRFRVSHATDLEALGVDLVEELRLLAAVEPRTVETTLLIHPWVLSDFLAFNDFLAVADALVDELGMRGEVQLASFHPDYRFAGTRAEDPGNCTNRSPFPILHLLREASIEGAVAAIADPSAIYQRNIETMQRLGAEGWERLRARFATDFSR
ncbi:MAG TPA: DUF1415 domain-containing protein [Burkholderiaceae bacterium]|nr:DUF1415 domain-containing protein [Burkholderiaceae bacterium]